MIDECATATNGTPSLRDARPVARASSSSQCGAKGTHLSTAERECCDPQYFAKLSACCNELESVSVIMIVFVQQTAVTSASKPGELEPCQESNTRGQVGMDSPPTQPETTVAPSLAPSLGLGRRAKLVTASVNFGLTAYATLTVAAIKMLHCVWVPGTSPEERRLFVHASVVCHFSGWQAPYVVLVVLLVAVPALLPFAAAWSRRVGGSAWDNDVRLGVRRALVDCYHPKAYWWEAALMAQRLVRPSCY